MQKPSEKRLDSVRASVQALGGDAWRVAAILERGRDAARAHRRRVARVVAYPLTVGILAVMGGVWLAATKLPIVEAASAYPLIDAPRSPAAVATSGGSVPWPLVTAGVFVASAGTAIVFGLFRSPGQRRLRAMVACELLAALPCEPGGLAACERLVGDLCGEESDLGRTAGPPLPPLSRLTADPSGGAGRSERLQRLADFYADLDERVRLDRLRWLPACGLFLAGCAVMAYAAMLFVPLSRMLEAVSVASTAEVQP